jgi:hypothetical protein
MDLRRIITFAGFVLVALLTLAAPASASFSVDSPVAQPVDPRAAAHSDFSLSFDLGGDEKIRDLDLELPPGLLGNPNSTAVRCTEDQLNSDSCPPGSTVGVTTIDADATVVVVPVPITAQGTIYNMQPHAGEPARLGIVVRPLESLGLGKIFLQSPVSVRTASDFGLTSILRDMPTTSAGLPIHVTGISMTLNADASKGKFMTNPTSCQAATTRLRATSYDGTVATASSTFTPTACDALAFAPRLGAVAGGAGNTGSGAHPALTATVEQGPDEAATRTVRVELPPQFGVDQARLSNLCDPAQALAHACPEASKIGDAEAITPLLAVPLTGSVYMTANPSGLPRLTADLQGLLALQLTGDVGYGRGIINTFDGIPDVPLSRFVLRFAGGPNGALVAQSDLCAARGLELTGAFTAHSGATTTVTTPLQLEGCAPSGGAATRPALSATVTRLASGQPSIVVKMSRAAGGSKLKAVTVTLPSGLTFDRAAVRRGLSGKAGNKRVSVSGVKVNGRKLTIAKLPSKTADVVRLVLSRGAVRASSKLRKRAKSRPRLAFAARGTDAKGAHFTVKRTVRGR